MILLGGRGHWTVIKLVLKVLCQRFLVHWLNKFMGHCTIPLDQWIFSNCAFLFTDLVKVLFEGNSYK